MEPVVTDRTKQDVALRPEQAYTLMQVIRYLNGADLNRARRKLEEVRL